MQRGGADRHRLREAQGESDQAGPRGSQNHAAARRDVEQLAQMLD